MKRILMVGVAGALCALGAVNPPEQKAAPKAVTKKSAKAKKPAEPPGPPAGAKQIEPGVFRAVDAKGQAWIYSQTPFGWMKGLEKQGRAESPIVPTDWKVTEAGDELQFERPYPFGGSMKWSKKKSELNETEAEVWKKHSQRTGVTKE